MDTMLADMMAVSRAGYSAVLKVLKMAALTVSWLVASKAVMTVLVKVVNLAASSVQKMAVRLVVLLVDRMV